MLDKIRIMWYNYNIRKGSANMMYSVYIVNDGCGFEEYYGTYEECIRYMEKNKMNIEDDEYFSMIDDNGNDVDIFN